MRIHTKGCQECPLKQVFEDDTKLIVYCELNKDGNAIQTIEYKDIIHGEDNPIVGSPDWCPLKVEPVTIQLIKE